MSRNLLRLNCDQCASRVAITGDHYGLTGTAHNDGMRVADAECQVCGAKYTAWISPMSVDNNDPREMCYRYGGRDSDRSAVQTFGFYDLSYRSTFNDEPGPDDVPIPVDVFRVVMDGDKELHRERLDS